MNTDQAEVLVAIALIFACAWFAIATAQPPKRERPSRLKRQARPGPVEASAVGETASVATAGKTSGSTRPRIFTGESTIPTPAKPASKRALKLVVGMTALAAAGAIGLLAFVGAMVKLFTR
jgi:hypothetical protein